MRILPLNFLLYSIGGVWRPIEWSSNRSKMLYSLFTFFSIYSLTFLLVTQILDMIFIIENIEDCITNFLLLLSVISVLFKIAAVVTRRDQIVHVIQILQRRPCRARCEQETDIQMKFDHLIRSHSINYTLLAMISATGAVAGGMLDTFEGELPYNVWVPYDYSSSLSLWLTSLQETIGLILGTIINIATETSVLGFCLQICAQFEILKHRLQRMVNSTEEILEYFPNHTPDKTNRLSEHVCHHLIIIRIAKMINDIFNQVIFVQFFISILVLCSSLYHISSNPTITDLATMIVYVLAMFVQIFIYCWAGNEVMLQSTGLSEGVYQMDWTLMTISERRDLLMIMKRSTRPIKLTSSFLVTLSLTSYGNLLKTSYSAFNVLQQS